MRIDYCPNCNSTYIEYIDSYEGVSTQYYCLKCGADFDYDEARHDFVDDKFLDAQTNN